ncbi:hypothetical protein D9758_019028 [Tetrapyrgos nigripes]|uniref:Activator of Hsp90 ATPase homologue 1/2-like C-terminal domain-containing protein n=1 Tax=Tetrapyrgos nigripes TaxID=182062 RepID=A0A8H5BB43_9AGAR|nr:hypothetical protein D9758_019028 [Tetrapyrgos nigripes]
MAAVDDLFGLLTDEKRIPMWTRANAKVWRKSLQGRHSYAKIILHSDIKSEAKPGTEYSLFSGGVTGKYVSLDPPTKIVQTWALQSPTWPSGHTGNLTTTFDQSSDSTKVTLNLEGVLLGQQDEIRRNIEGYYIHGLKSIGYVQLFPSPPSYSLVSSSSKVAKRASSTSREAPSSTSTYVVVGLITFMIVVAAFAIPYLSSEAINIPSAITMIPSTFPGVVKRGPFGKSDSDFDQTPALSWSFSPHLHIYRLGHPNNHSWLRKPRPSYHLKSRATICSHQIIFSYNKCTYTSDTVGIAMKFLNSSFILRWFSRRKNSASVAGDEDGDDFMRARKVVEREDGHSVEGDCQRTTIDDRFVNFTWTSKYHALSCSSSHWLIQWYRLEFLPDYLQKSDEVYFRTTNIPRTTESLQQIIHGLYPTSKCHTEAVPPLFIRNTKDENLSGNASCKRLEILLIGFAQASAYNHTLEPLDKKLSKYIGGNPIRVDGNRERQIHAASAHGIKVPPKFEEKVVIDTLEKAVVTEWFAGCETFL